MNVKNVLKKVVAIGASSVMVGATIMGALALDLSEYPEPFVTDGVFDGKIVVGANAQPADIVAAIDIAASLQSAAVEEVAVEVTTDSVSVTGGETEEVNFGACVSGTSYDDGDLAGLLDSEITFNDEDVDVEEKIYVESNELCVEDAEYKDDYADTPYLVTKQNRDSIYYVFDFEDDKINYSEVGEGTGEDTLEIKFLGRNIEITELADASMTVVSSTERYMEEGDSIEIDGHTVTLDRVGDGSVRVTVDGQSLTIAEGADEEFDDAGDYTVEVKDGSIFYIEGADDNSATLKLGDDISDSVDEGDTLELFGESDEDDEAEWYWKEIKVDGDDYLDLISVGYNQKRVSLDDPEGFYPIAEGESIYFPDQYASIEFANVKKDTRHEVKIYFEDGYELNRTDDDEDVIIFQLPTDEDYFILDGSTKTDRIYVQTADDGEPWYLWYRDDTDKVRFDTVNATFNLTLDADNIVITPTATDGDNFSIIDENTVDTIEFEVTVASGGYQYFGGTEEDADSELFFETVDIAGKDDPYLTDYGIIIKGSGDSDGPEDGMDDDELYLLVPEERPEAEIVFRGPGTTVATTGDAVSYQVNPIAVGMAVLDTNAPTLGSEPMLVLGGPVVNTYAAELLGNPTPEQIAEMFSPGKAMIKLYETQNAILVAGYDPEETMGAAYVLADYEDYDLSGAEVEVVVPSLTSITVNPVE
jgi:hypothetical protein